MTLIKTDIHIKERMSVLTARPTHHFFKWSARGPKLQTSPPTVLVVAVSISRPWAGPASLTWVPLPGGRWPLSATAPAGMDLLTSYTWAAPLRPARPTGGGCSEPGIRRPSPTIAHIDSGCDEVIWGWDTCRQSSTPCRLPSPSASSTAGPEGWCRQRYMGVYTAVEPPFTPAFTVPAGGRGRPGPVPGLASYVTFTTHFIIFMNSLRLGLQ